MNPVLHQLTSDRLMERLFGVATPEAVVAVLRRTDEVAAVDSAVCAGALSSEDIREFVGHLLTDFTTGQRFWGDIALSALATALAATPNPVADEFLADLQSTKVAELPLSSRVAALLILHRQRRWGGMTSRESRVSEMRPAALVTATPPFTVVVDQTDDVLEAA